VDVETFRPVRRGRARRRIGLEEASPVAVYVGRLVPRKDVGNILRALALLARPAPGGDGPPALPVTLLVVGGDSAAPDPVATPELGALQRLAAELGLAGRVRFVGKRPAAELRHYYGAGDVAVTTPWYEPYGLTPLEAMACGRPVIGSAVGGLTFTIADGETGFLVPPRDPEALAGRLRQLLTRPALVRRLGRAARARVEREFTWPVTATRTAALYRAILASGRPGPPAPGRDDPRGEPPEPARGAARAGVDAPRAAAGGDGVRLPAAHPGARRTP
jgi:glycosyltransferase involved in cell wall biosynthesis